jgi:hypothetical protein
LSYFTFDLAERYFYRIFDILYDLDLVTEDAFLAWEQDLSRETDSKEVTMVRGGRQFLEWLKNAETE